MGHVEYLIITRCYDVTQHGETSIYFPKLPRGEIANDNIVRKPKFGYTEHDFFLSANEFRCRQSFPEQVNVVPHAFCLVHDRCGEKKFDHKKCRVRNSDRRRVRCYSSRSNTTSPRELDETLRCTTFNRFVKSVFQFQARSRFGLEPRLFGHTGRETLDGHGSSKFRRRSGTSTSQ